MFYQWFLSIYFISLISYAILQGIDIFKDSNKLYKLNTFQDTLESYAKQPLDLVFLLDESGSVGSIHYETEKDFIEIIARTLNISASNTRTALVSFASKTRLHFNYLSRTDGDACNFMRNLKAVDYKDGGTDTEAGLYAAEKVFAHSRPKAKRVIMLLSDGQSKNEIATIAASRVLKNKGIIIFCVGIAGAVERELLAVSSGPQYLYIISDFNYVKQVYYQLRHDIQNVALVQQPKHNCQGQCDTNAGCYCGTDGKYECACNIGYMGSGVIGFCTKCPYGTYNSMVNQIQCMPCPPNSNTTHEAATSESDCKCQSGYVGNSCMFSGCPELHAPIGGHLEPKKCGTSLGDKCSFWCDKGYCPHDGSEERCLQEKSKKIQKPPRVCLITGKWTGTPFKCDEARCKPPKNPENGVFDCNTVNFEVKHTMCILKCNPGYKYKNKEVKNIRCDANGTWKNIETAICSSVECKPLKKTKKNYLKPEDCSKKVQPFDKQCQIYCHKEYQYTRNPDAVITGLPYGLRICNNKGKWDGLEGYTCKDIQPPKITCPKSMKVDCPPNEKVSDEVTWELPNATDNDSPKPKIECIYPSFEKNKRQVKPPYRFEPGENKLVYQATDKNNNSAKCSFIIEVADRKAPDVKVCPEPQDIYTTSTDPITVDWNKPEFEDNSNMVKVTYRSHEPNKDKLETNQVHMIKYLAEDKFHNSASCEFEIRLNPYQCDYRRPPLHGTLNCKKVHRSAQECTVACDKGFAFASTPLPVYKCVVSGGVGDWEPLDKTWPDCSKKNKVKTSSSEVTIKSKNIDCKKLETNKQYANKVAARVCKGRPKCNVENVKVSCKKQQSNGRRKRDVTEEESELTIEFDISTEDVLDTNRTLEEIAEEENKKLQAAVEEIAIEEGSEVDISVTKKITVSCDTGQVFNEGKCVNCPAGTFYKDNSCVLCLSNSYQNEEASTQCKPCPDNTFTISSGSVAVTACLKPCGPGKYSKTGLEQCTGCAKGFYQDLPQKKSCKPCPPNTSTWMLGADSITSCLVPCKPGSSSATGFESCDLCPRGSFQPKSGKTGCIPCKGILYTDKEGMTDESTCIEIDFCNPNPCQHKGTCTRSATYEAECTCGEGIAGPLCEINIDDCEPHFCLNNGVCVDGINDYTCSCAPGFEGPKCEDNIDDCHEGACLNGGICRDGTNNFTCDCLQGYAGNRCQFAMDKCDSSPCLKGGKCMNKKIGFLCCCKDGFSGAFCEIKENDCISSNPCLHGSTCTLSANDFKCNCAPGYTGLKCEQNIDECSNQPCQNHATCIDLINDFECKCHLGFDGKMCENKFSTDFDIEFKAPKISNYAIMETKEDLESITVMFWMKTNANTISRGTPVSFSYKSPVNGSVTANAITWYDVNKFIISIQNQEIRTTIQGGPQWHNYALTWESLAGTYSVYIDGKFIFGGTNISPGVPLYKGFFVLGQEQDTLAGGFSSTESFVGHISQFNVWNFAMNEKEIGKVSKKCGFVGNVVAWPDVRKKILGNDVAIISGHCKSIGSCGSTPECFCQEKNIYNKNLCERSVEICSANVCHNGQTCTKTGDTNICNCETGFTGRFCQYDVNECFINNGNCSHTCHNTLGSYSCSCPSDYYMSKDKHTCLSKNICNYKGLLYSNGEDWHENCETCKCNEGIVTCKQDTCPPVKCQHGIKPVIFPGDCCKKCIESKIATCVVLPNNLYQTFDGDSSMKLTASCRHILAQDCAEGTFEVQIENIAKNNAKKQLAINIDCENIKISHTGVVELQKKKIDLPYNNSKLFLIEKEITYQRGSKKESIIVTIYNGVIVEWSNYGRISVKVLDKMEGRLCGLCGNYNGNKYDDWMMRNYNQATTLTEFASSWRVNFKKCSQPEYHPVGTPDLKKIGLCKNVENKDVWHTAQFACKILRENAFQPCYKFTDAQGYLDLCLQDACRCPNELCHCHAIRSYQEQCKKYIKNFNGLRNTPCS